jgi:signal transduction histidine kinase
MSSDFMGRKPPISHRSGGHGLAGMTNRAAALRGRLQVESAAGKGTTARLEIPLARRRMW